MIQINPDGSIKSSPLDVSVGVIFVIAAISAVIGDIATSRKCAKAGLYERNKWFQDKRTRQVILWKLIAYKSAMFAATSVIALVLTYGYGAGYFSFFVYIGVFFVNGYQTWRNLTLLKRHRKATGQI